MPDDVEKKDETNEEDIKKWAREHDVDNRDINTTWLWIDQYESPEGFIEVDPWELLTDAIENLGFLQEVERALLRKVSELHEEVVLLLPTTEESTK